MRQRLGWAAVGGFVVMLFMGTAWPGVKDWQRGVMVTESDLDTYVSQALLHLKEVLGSIEGFFSGVQLRTHPDGDKAASQVCLLAADMIILTGGLGVADWPVLCADITLSGPGGLDDGAEAASTNYEIHAIRKSSDGTRAIMLHRSRDLFLDESQTGTTAGSVALRDNAARTSVAQGFIPSESKPFTLACVQLNKTGSPTGQTWLTLESDSGGSPGAELAKSDMLNTSGFIAAAGWAWACFPFREPYTMTATTQYHLRVQGNFAVSGANYVSIRTAGSGVYANGQIKTFDGVSTWTGAADDAVFTVNVVRNETDLVYPSGYDQSALIGYVYNNGSSDFIAFEARDKKVTPLENTAVYSGCGTCGTVGPTTVVTVPYRPVKLWFSARMGASGTTVLMAPFPAGYSIASASTPRTGGSVKYVGANNTTIDSLGPIHTDYNQVYTVNDNSTIAVDISSWEW